MNHYIKIYGRCWVLAACLLAGGVHAQNAIRAAVTKPLQAAQELMKNGKAAEATELAKTALAVGELSAPERVLIERIIAAAAIQAKDYKTAIASLNHLLSDGGLVDKERQAYQLTLIGVLRTVNDLDALSKVARTYLNEGGSREDVRALYLQVLSLQDRHQDLSDFANAVEKSNPSVKWAEAELKLLAIAKSKLKDDAGYYETLKKLVTIAPKQPDYWRELVSQLQRRSFFSARYELDVARLMAAKGLFQTAEEYLEYASLALKFGFPAEAKSALDAGDAAKLFESAERKNAYQKAMNEAKRKSLEDEAQLRTLKSATGAREQAELAEILFSMADYNAARDVYRTALQAGSHRRESELRLHFLVALHRGGMKEEAQSQLERIKADQTAFELGHMWLIGE